MVLRLKTGTGSYVQKNECLSKNAWLVNDLLREQNYYAWIATYPGWTNMKDAGDFGIVNRLFKVNGLDTLCIQIRPSPIRESFADKLEFSGGDKCRQLLADRVPVELTPSSLSKLKSNREWPACGCIFQQSRFVRSIQGIVNLDCFEEGVLIASSGSMPAAIIDMHVEDGLQLFWLNFINDPSLEYGVHLTRTQQGPSGYKERHRE